MATGRQIRYNAIQPVSYTGKGQMAKGRRKAE
jgi:hypothetical protein